MRSLRVVVPLTLAVLAFGLVMRPEPVPSGPDASPTIGFERRNDLAGWFRPTSGKQSLALPEQERARGGCAPM